MNALERLIRRRIALEGPLRLSDYMQMCLAHPEHGYYVTRDPLGAGGDFVTAPEISQMFGELLGLWAAQVWIDMGRPRRATLAELGPGRGTLMADALRAAGRVPGFAEAVRPWLVEISPALRRRQRQALAGRAARWVSRPEDLPEGPLIVLANEFFDALPIRQFERRGGVWRERVVALREGRLALALGPAVPWDEDAPEGALREDCPDGRRVAALLGARLRAHGGAALIVDYGYLSVPPMGGDTFQALRGGRYADPFAAPGEADLTAHVDFGALARAAAGAGAVAWPAATQGVLLERLGVTERARALARAAASRAQGGEGGGGDAVEAIVAAHRRLTHPDEMGSLFKALALTGPGQPAPPGFAPEAGRNG
ncbi:class I SAM-dependent methyltransferase [Oceanicella actignis]|uniref:class I SAM-dependent methyltransferase n=1 Tax=Oceanicella actignis TaxID=1189325 RepID=UPI0011E73B96|nr:SAM-dependent methyltransferase [Oceanicella actignis]TYO85454.1 SAM-dependent MidA family methyltransferase [Oceanicella actignis]